MTNATLAGKVQAMRAVLETARCKEEVPVGTRDADIDAAVRLLIKSVEQKRSGRISLVEELTGWPLPSCLDASTIETMRIEHYRLADLVAVLLNVAPAAVLQRFFANMGESDRILVGEAIRGREEAQRRLVRRLHGDAGY